ncbi:HupE/UreJ family protein [Synechococcus sp. CS-1325]|uniref:HupE/UreJ family protein n=1 Tax=unclassified Synechococcus TaxID=2626047 RepID=UPI0021A2D8F5|nr:MULTISPECIES: HupE/UreJ family protein [unclassified Synechococcus]MCT0199249.1 HupE/UreJ family protein [Synechococcus sp. CS-1325]MCT0212125.1 HupE/UreJ family protein [Synechococcus sp. CS-1326]MCT0232913.1 HupE/UreJ family protein [Synechococcus sp. CS-1327]
MNHRIRVAAAAPAVLLLLGVPLLAAPASAHHLMELFQIEASPLGGFLSGLGHPLLGPDHLLFLLCLGLVGLQQPGRWLIGLLAVGLGASGVGLLLPTLPGAELLVALSLVALGLVVIGRWPRWVLLPAIALHGYVLSDAVIGWEAGAIGFYLLGLLISQATLLLAAVALIRPWAGRLSPTNLKLVAGMLIGIGATFAWTGLVP